MVDLSLFKQNIPVVVLPIPVTRMQVDLIHLNQTVVQIAKPLVKEVMIVMEVNVLALLTHNIIP